MIWIALRALLLFYLCALENALLGPLAGYVPDLSAILLVFAATSLRPAGALPVVCGLAWFRAFFGPAGPLFELWQLGLLYLLLLPAARRLFVERAGFRVLLGAGSAVALSLSGAAFLGEGGGDPLGRHLGAWVLTGLLTPVLLPFFALLCRGLPAAGLLPRRAVAT